ncbi:MAG: zinc-binding dehydrogenase [Armatimonadetes bacterium]|nr:zinc-binding dehydrogenase [Armatimonadota bacterium]
MNAVRGRPAAVNGLGPAGVIAAQLLKAEGATSVTAFELSAKRREEALRHGFVDAALDPSAEETLREYPAGHKPFDVSIDCVGYPNAVRFLMDRTRRHFSLFAVQRHDYVFTPGDYQLILVGYQGHSKPAAEYAMARIAAGELEMRPLATVELPLERYLEGVKLLERQEATKICYRP